MAQVGLIEQGESSRWYEHPQTGLQLESVTHIIAACRSKPWLQDWAAKLAAIWAVDNNALIAHNLDAGVDREAVVAMVSKAAQRKREQARDLGSHVHHVIEALLTDVPLPDFDALGLDEDAKTEIYAVVDGFLAFVSDFEPEMLQSEATVADPVLGIAGTLDFGMILKRLNGRRIMVDAKSGSKLDAEIIPQLAAYMTMPEAWLPTGLVVESIKYDGAAVLHLRPEHRNGYKLILIDEADLKSGYEWLLAIREQYRHAQAHPKLRGQVIYPALPDGSQPLPYLDDINGWGQARGALRRAGFVKLDELVGFNPRELQTHDGIGPGTCKSLYQMLDQYGVTS